MKRPSYREAVAWLAGNDDCHWLAEPDNLIPSVSACLIRDLFDVEETRLNTDILLALKRHYPDHPAIRAQ